MNKKPKTIRKCFRCGKEFQTYPYLIKKGEGKFCSQKCGWKNNPTKIKKGQRLSPSTEFKKGQIPWNYNYDDDISMQALHTWVKKRLGKLKKCEHCGTTKAKRYDWANKSREYNRLNAFSR